MKTYKPISGKTNDFKLQDTTRAREDQIHELQVRFKGISIEERKAICDYEGWLPEEHIPELSVDVRFSATALGELCKRTLGEEDSLRPELEKLVKNYSKEVEKVDPISPDDYWFELAQFLFKTFECADRKQIKFKVVEQARKDFFN